MFCLYFLYIFSYRSYVVPFRAGKAKSASLHVKISFQEGNTEFGVFIPVISLSTLYSNDSEYRY